MLFIFSTQNATQAICAYNSVIMSTQMAMLGNVMRGCRDKVVIDSFTCSPAIEMLIKRHPLFPVLSYRVDRWHLWQGGYIRHN